ncbi:hypothetical protein OG291_07485 [Streptomyces halstedii]|uniref:hypothetical protein n=1 Tax=Streptomyces halstedii TaxID=1944 RepID=UPI003864CDAD|nr:hypothetical protein OG291_07485 [Streptomyces halstedii]
MPRGRRESDLYSISFGGHCAEVTTSRVPSTKVLTAGSSMMPLSMPFSQYSYQRNIVSCSSTQGRDCIGGSEPISSFLGPFSTSKTSMWPSRGFSSMNHMTAPW